MRPLALAVVWLAASGCGDPADAPPAAETVAVRGVFVESLYDGQAARIDHEAIPGHMDAMRMDFRVADPSLLNGLAEGDKATFEVEVDPAIRVVGVERLPADTPLELAPRGSTGGV